MNTNAHTGKIGEEIAKNFLVGKGYEVLGSNYRKHHGEIDIVERERDTLVFVEVKTILNRNIDDVTRETYRPEFNVHKEKIRVISRTAELYMLENRILSDWRIDLVAIEMQLEPRKAKIRHLKSISL